ncbi:MAG: hypothetical protein CBC48_06600 [bacterium TMED88]|nr:cytochrome P450 [Deltaproteobacteria bacterium]OUV33959.1 MAG: hypothetical protein CBC48_06600 [bacterium TMED88]
MSLLDFATDPMPGPVMHSHLRQLREQGPVVEVRFGGQPAFLITTFEALLEGFRDVETLPPATLYQRSIAAIIGENFQSMEGPQHRLYRRLATPAFRSRAVERFADDEIAALAHEVIDRFIDQTEIDLVSHFTRLFPFLLISRMLGVPREGESAFHRWAWEMLSPPTVSPEVSRAADREFTRYIAPTIAARRAEPQGDVISALVESEAEGHCLDDREVLSHVKLLFSAGATTTHDALGSLVHTLLASPEAWSRIVSDQSLRPGAILELLRWETPVPNLPRISADRSIEFLGKKLPPQSFVLFSMAAANRDPAAFENPDLYDIERPMKDTLTFGRGERSCPGMHLAKKSLAVALDALADRFPDLRLSGDPDASAPTGATVRGPDRLTVMWH